MEKVFNRRFGDTEEGFKVYQEWIQSVISLVQGLSTQISEVISDCFRFRCSP